MQVRDIVVEAASEGPGGAASAVVLRTGELTLRSLPAATRSCDSSAGAGCAGGAEALEALEAVLRGDSRSEADLGSAIEAVRACPPVRIASMVKVPCKAAYSELTYTPGKLAATTRVITFESGGQRNSLRCPVTGGRRRAHRQL